MSESDQTVSLRVQLMGDLTVSGDHGTVTMAQLGGRRGAVVFARLALAHRRVHRDELAEALWDDQPPATWRSALRNVVSDLRFGLASLGADPNEVLVSVGQAYQLSLPPGSVIDVEELLAGPAEVDARLEAGDAAGALELIRTLGTGTAAPDVGHREDAEHGDWVDDLLGRIRAARHHLHLTGGRIALDLGDAATAETYANAAIAVAPLREDGHRLLMEALAAGGNTAAAVRTYEELRRSLRDDLGIRPSPATESLFLELLDPEQKPDPDPVTDAPPGAHVPSPDHFGDPLPLGAWRRASNYSRQVARAALDAHLLEDAEAAADTGLAVLQKAGDPDPAVRIELETIRAAAWRAGGDPRAAAALRAVFADAVDEGDPILIAQAALAAGGDGAAADEMFVDERQRQAYERALAALGDADDRLRASLLGRLASGVGWTADRHLAQQYIGEAVVLARAVGDLPVLSSVLSTARRLLSGAGEAERSDEIEQELEGIARELDDPELFRRVQLWRFGTSIELGRGRDLEWLLDAASWAESGPAPANDRFTLGYNTAALALLRGDLEVAEIAIEQAARFGRKHGIEGVIVEGVRLVQQIGLRFEQSRLELVYDEVVDFLPGAGIPEWEGPLALIEGELGLLDRVDERLTAVFAGLEARGLRTATGMAFAASMANPIGRIGSREKAAVLYDLLLPHADMGAMLAYFVGPVAWSLGICAGVLGDPDRATGHFRDAAAFCQRLGAPRWERRCLDAASFGGLPPHS